MLRVVLHDGAADDLRNLETEPQIAFMDAVVAIAVAPNSHKHRLVHHSEVGDLHGCFKAYFDPDPDRWPLQPARFRIVFTLLPDESRPDAVYVWAIGPRDGLEVYRRAAARLMEL